MQTIWRPKQSHHHQQPQPFWYDPRSGQPWTDSAWALHQQALRRENRRQVFKRAVRGALIGFVAGLLLLAAGISTYGLATKSDPLNLPVPKVQVQAPVPVPVNLPLPGGLHQTPDQKRLVAEARALCKTMLATDNRVCDQLPIEFRDLNPGAIATVTLVMHPQGSIEPQKMSIDPDMLKSEPKLRRHYLAHEWSHVRIAQIATTPVTLEHIHRQAAASFGKRLGGEVDPAKAGELLTDCMTWGRGYSVGVNPVYVSSYGAKPETFCMGWESMLVP